MTYDQKQLGTALMLYEGSSKLTTASLARGLGATGWDCHWFDQSFEHAYWTPTSPIFASSSGCYLTALQCLGLNSVDTSMVHGEFRQRKARRSTDLVCDSFGQQLDRNKTLETFLIGPENFAAARQVLDPACGSGSLLLHGSEGVGKSHLLSALAHAAIQQGQSVRFLTAEYLFWRFGTGRLEADLRRPDPVVDLFLLDNAEYFEAKTITPDFRRALALLKGHARRTIVASNEVPWRMADLDPAVHALLFQELSIELTPLGQDTLHWINPGRWRQPTEPDHANNEWKQSQTPPFDDSWTAFVDFISPGGSTELSPWFKLGELFEVYLAVDAVSALYDASVADVLSPQTDLVIPEARYVLFFLLIEELGRDPKDVAECLGVPPTAAEKMNLSVRSRLDQRGQLLERVTSLRKAIYSRVTEDRWPAGYQSGVR